MHYVLSYVSLLLIFVSIDTATTHIYTLSLHDALPICGHRDVPREGAPPRRRAVLQRGHERADARPPAPRDPPVADRKSTRLNSSHLGISYAVFCLKKKK